MKCIQCYRATPYSGYLFLAFAIFALLSAKPLTAQSGKDWEKIGEKKVSRKLDRDEIPVTNEDTRFTAIQFRVVRSTVNIARCSIHFENGKVKDVRLGRDISEGDASKVIKFGAFGARSVKKVVVWYDTVDDADKRGMVEVWARK